tara:strand:- start:423 stop:743 length:321 start_codon:yes stop_codon:yes gene_type:complete
MKRYLYFGEAAVETTGESCMFSLDAFLGMTPLDASTTQMFFKSRNGAATDDNIRMTHTGTTTKAFMTEIVKYLQANQRNPFLVIGDRTNPGAVTNMVKSIAVSTEA